MASEEAKDAHDAPREGLDDQLQRELNEALGDASIEELMAADAQAEQAAMAEQPHAPQFTPEGELIRRGKVIAVQGDDIFVELGGKAQGVLPSVQFEDEPLPEIGATVEFTIQGRAPDGLLTLSRKGAVQAAAWETLKEGQIVEGRVTGLNKGGLELDINGIRAFMPLSQIERFRVEDKDLDGYLNERLQCQVVEADPREKNLIVSQRTLQERQAAQQAEKLWETIDKGQVLQGVVKTIMPYGAFVDVGGTDGLLHVSDMSHAHVDDPHQVVTKGQTIEVKVLKVNREQHKLSLGLKQTMPDPWQGIEGRYREGEIVSAKITRLADFGAFAELEPGVEGLIPISEMSYTRRVRTPGEVLSEGDTVKLKVLSVDPKRKRISLSLKQVEDDPWTGASVRWPAESVVEGRVKRVTDFGAFVELSPGVEGLVHISELSHEFVRSPQEAVQEGQTIQAKVLSVDEESRRISLSIKQATEAPAQPSSLPPRRPENKRKRPLKGGLD